MDNKLKLANFLLLFLHYFKNYVWHYFIRLTLENVEFNFTFIKANFIILQCFQYYLIN